MLEGHPLGGHILFRDAPTPNGRESRRSHFQCRPGPLACLCFTFTLVSSGGDGMNLGSVFDGQTSTTACRESRGGK